MERLGNGSIQHAGRPAFVPRRCACVPVGLFTQWTDRFGVLSGKWKVLRSDSIQFDKEMAAASIDSEKFVINKWKSRVRERQKVRDCPIHHGSADPMFGSFLMLWVSWRDLHGIPCERTS